jgi:hypothetical protein
MHAASILPHYAAAFVCAFGLLFFPTKRPQSDRRSGQDRRKQPALYPNQRLSDLADTPEDVVNRLQLTHKPTWADVDVAYCTEDELLLCVANVIQSTKQLTLSDREIAKFWEVRAELQRREYRAPLQS